MTATTTDAIRSAPSATIAEAMGLDSQARAELGVLAGGEPIEDLI